MTDETFWLSEMLLAQLATLRGGHGRPSGRIDLCCRIGGCRTATSGDAKIMQIAIEEILIYAPSSGTLELDMPLLLTYSNFALAIYRRGADYVAWRHDGSKRMHRTDGQVATRFFETIDRLRAERRGRE